MKKFISCLLAVLMIAMLSVTAFAADDPAPGDIIITNTDSDHTYLAYEIFAGNITTGESGLPKMDITKWGCGITEAGIKALCSAYSVEVSDDSGANNYWNSKNIAGQIAAKLNGTGAIGAEAFADILMSSSTYLLTDEQAQAAAISHHIAFAAGEDKAVLDVHHQGYYLVVDEPNSLKDKTSDSYTDYILVVVAGQDVTVAHKNDVPTVIKKVQENTNITAATVDQKLPNHELTENYNDTADYSIGDKIPYEMIASLPSTLNNYDTYTLTFNDTMNGMEYVGQSLKVYVRHTDGSLVELASGTADNGYINSVTNGNKTLTVTINMKKNANGTFALSTKNGTTPVDAASYIIVRYEAALTNDAVIGSAGNKNTAYLEFSNNPNNKDDMGKTPTDETIVYTYELNVVKTNAEDKSKLAGAEFVIQRTVDGKADPNGYAVLTAVKGEVPSEGGEAPVIGYKVASWGALSGATAMPTDAKGEINIIGLDRGHYFLTETKAPEGYTALTSPIEIAIDASIGNTQSWNGSTTLSNLTINVTDPNKMTAAINDGIGNIDDGTVGIAVANNATAQLPTTGGIGTTMFYIIGSVLAIGAAFVFVVRRRMSVKEQ